MENNTENVLAVGVSAADNEVTPTENKPVIDPEKVAAAKKKADDYQKELEEKLYPFKIESEEKLKSLIDFIENHAPWKNMESLGIIRLSEKLRENKEKVKSGNIYLKSLELDALAFFISQMTGKGLESAKVHLSYMQPITNSLNMVKGDNATLNQLLLELEAAEQGIEVEPKPEN